MGEPVVRGGIGVRAWVSAVDLGYVGRDDTALGTRGDSEPDGDSVCGVARTCPPHHHDLPILKQRSSLVDTVRDGTGHWDSGICEALTHYRGVETGGGDADFVEPIFGVYEGSRKPDSLACGGSAADDETKSVVHRDAVPNDINQTLEPCVPLFYLGSQKAAP